MNDPRPLQILQFGSAFSRSGLRCKGHLHLKSPAQAEEIVFRVGHRVGCIKRSAIRVIRLGAGAAPLPRKHRLLRLRFDPVRASENVRGFALGGKEAGEHCDRFAALADSLLDRWAVVAAVAVDDLIHGSLNRASH
jgi:hypothetical protein